MANDRITEHLMSECAYWRELIAEYEERVEHFKEQLARSEKNLELWKNRK